MLKLALAASVTLVLVPAAFAQAPTDRVKIDVSRADLQPSRHRSEVDAG